MEEGFRKAIIAIEMATGERPTRIEMPGGCHLVKFAGVDFLLTASQAGYLFMKHVVVPATAERESGEENK